MSNMDEIEFHIPTEQYGFILVKRKALPSQVKQIYDEYAAEFAPKPINSLPTKEWNKFVERVLLNEPNHIEELEQCSPEQYKTINEIKKGLARIASREPKEPRDRFAE